MFYNPQNTIIPSGKLLQIAIEAMAIEIYWNSEFSHE